MIKKYIKYVLAFVIMIVIFCLLLTLTSLFPSSRIENNVKESAQTLTEQTNRYMVKISSKRLYMMFDNFTDALMINTAYSIDNKTPFYSAMMAKKNYIKDKTEIIYSDTTGELKSSSKYSELDQVGDLNDTLNKDTSESFEYARYWHGYLVVLRPLLLVMNISRIRLMLTIVLIVLATILLVLLYKKISLPTAIIFLLGMFISDYFYMGISLQGVSVFLIAIITSILILIDKIKDKKMLFLITGGLTCFFDFLTVPIITLGIPLVAETLINEKENNLKYKEKIIRIITLIAFWSIGYIGVWATKWVLVDLIYQKGLIYSVIQQIGYRSISSGEKYNLFNVLKRMWSVIKIPFLCSITITVFMLLCKMLKNISKLKIDIKQASLYFFIGMIAIVWYAVIANHSYLHYIFTYRNFFLISICFMLTIYNLFNKKNIN